MLLAPAAIYDCSAIDKEWRCISAVADDTAHLSENPNAPGISAPEQIVVKKKKALGDAVLAFYIADESTLLDKPEYRKLDLKDHQIKLPPIAVRSVLIAIYKTPKQSTKTKIVWLLAPPQQQ